MMAGFMRALDFKAGDLVDKKTQGKYASTVDKVQDAARKAVADPSVKRFGVCVGSMPALMVAS